MKAWKIREECATDSERWKGLGKTCYSHRETAAKGENFTYINRAAK